MTREEAIVYFESLLKRFEEMHETETSYWGKVHTETTIEAIRTALTALQPVSREQVENYLYRITYDLLEGVVEEKAQGMSVRQEDKELIATLYKYLFVGLMLDWIKGDMKGDPQVMVQKLELVIHGSVAAALDRMRTDKPASNGAE